MPSASTTIRVKSETRERLGRLAAARQTSVSAVLDEIVESAAERELLAGAQAAWSRMATDEGWRSETADWEKTLADGLGD